jgi:hypothetical protein
MPSLPARQQKNVETMSEVRKYVTEIRQYFGDTSPDKEEDAGQIFFKTMSEFAVQYMKALKEIDEWAEQVSGLIDLSLFAVVVILCGVS